MTSACVPRPGSYISGRTDPTRTFSYWYGSAMWCEGHAQTPGRECKDESRRSPGSAVTAGCCSVAVWGQGSGRGEWRGPTERTRQPGLPGNSGGSAGDAGRGFPLESSEGSGPSPQEGEAAVASAQLALNRRSPTLPRVAHVNSFLKLCSTPQNTFFVDLTTTKKNNRYHFD